MNDLIKINNTQISIKEYKGQRVVTFKDIDTVHKRPEGTASRNFRENRDKFIENIDFYFVKPNDIQNDEIRRSEINNAGTYLITESGYLMLVKSLTDDLAWKVQRELVNTYFRAKEIKPATIEDLIIMQAQSVKELKAKVQILEHRIENLDAVNIEGTPRQRLNAMIRKYAFVLGIKHNLGWERFKQAYNTAFRTNLETLIANYKKNNNLKRLTIPEYLEFTNQLDDALRIADKMLNEVKGAQQ
jgi:hypothetical protein